MIAAEYLVKWLIAHGVSDIFGYPGGMVTGLLEALSRQSGKITVHISRHEQASAFAACGYAQAGGGLGVAFATSGPGATNLVTGICNAYFDSIPVLFLTGQVNSVELKGDVPVRQRGFQETDIVSMVSHVTKYAAQVSSQSDLKDHLSNAYRACMQGRRGPALLDLTMDMLRAEMSDNTIAPLRFQESSGAHADPKTVACGIVEAVQNSDRPVLLLGAGVKAAQAEALASAVAEKARIPIVTTMIATDLASGYEHNYGFIGAYGHRVANFLVAKADLVVSIGARLDVRQVGAKRDRFAQNARLIRLDVDEGELAYRVHDDEEQFVCDAAAALCEMGQFSSCAWGEHDSWLVVAEQIRTALRGIDALPINDIISAIGKRIPADVNLVADVGQNQVWIAQSLKVKPGSKVLYSGGHGAMGYSLPAAMGCAVATGSSVVSFNGDGGIQMNLQELETLAQERLPVTVVVVNNYALGMIRHFQEMYYNGNYVGTTEQSGYSAPDFCKVAEAFGIPWIRIDGIDDLPDIIGDSKGPLFIEVCIAGDTYIHPKLRFGCPNQDQEPLIDRKLYEHIMSL